MLLRNWQMVTFQSRDQLNELHRKNSGNSYDESNLSIFFCDLIQDNSEQNKWVENSVNIAIDQSPASSKSILESTRATRKDVYRRKMLRAIKKFFLMLFKHHNNKLVNKRLSKVSSTQILQALEDLSVVYITKEHPGDMAKFMLKFMNLNSKDNVRTNCEATEIGCRVSECIRSYSDDKFEALYSSEYFCKLISSFLNLRAASIESLLEMKSSQTWKNQSTPKINQFIALINKHLKANLEERVEARLQETHETAIKYSQKFNSYFLSICFLLASSQLCMLQLYFSCLVQNMKSCLPIKKDIRGVSFYIATSCSSCNTSFCNFWCSQTVFFV
ncbi:unnamed protein product [Moneuplotes crassus]|uniref:Uncharacterized protein n=1 Tax=Euplotes crassus TaxID=5936 RepID=A0AAD2D8X1_EUPCR|nr:unnamed protein product [Moneuplotes crassus]